ncbi:isopentenyl-diphosphate Delta-isomerase [Microbacterium indicum]|uniref:isopentenyl-diphosphate Delta-isomerase n=1 Tax=Microbacterium indicum TaxID=358100 RepID=UPI000686A1A4|nr:isopentenyl-diphosphate Delta-isomerase [Microbacterium indicum]
MAQGDRVILLEDDGVAIGTAEKTRVHDDRTPLHLAFSCYVFDASGSRVLVTRRALTKTTWPGVWTNSFCGHPRPFEELSHAVERRASDELGMTLTGIRAVLPDFRYRATDASGIVENEICPVYIATAASAPLPAPDEVAEIAWARPRELMSAARATPWAFSPWMVDQLDLLGAVVPAFTDRADAPADLPETPRAMRDRRRR